MRGPSFRAACIIVWMLLGPSGANAGVPGPISYQGQLNNQSGVPISGSVSLVFSLYDAPTGGVPLWSENQTIGVANGIFNAQLGSVTPFPVSLFERTLLYLGIRVGSDQEMEPRQRLAAASYANRANVDPLEIRSSPGFTGTGADGAFVSAGPQTLTRGRVYQFTSFNLTAGSVITATGGASNAQPIIIKVSGDCTIAGTIDLTGAGMTGEVDVPNTLEAGKNGAGYSGSGGLGGGGGSGASGCGFPGQGGGGAGGCWLFLAAQGLDGAFVGAGGGRGGDGQNGPAWYTPYGGGGGVGGGALVLFVGGKTTISGTIRVAGSSGLQGMNSSNYRAAGGGGGGGGGSILLFYGGQFVDAGAVYDLAGGAGGAGGSGAQGNGTSGGAGGAGKIVAVQVRTN